MLLISPLRASDSTRHGLKRFQTRKSLKANPPTIAVLPFKNMSNDEEQEYFADGVIEDIIANLSFWKSFPVISCNSSFSFKGQDLKNQRDCAGTGSQLYR